MGSSPKKKSMLTWSQTPTASPIRCHLAGKRADRGYGSRDSSAPGTSTDSAVIVSPLAAARKSQAQGTESERRCGRRCLAFVLRSRNRLIRCRRWPFQWPCRSPKLRTTMNFVHVTMLLASPHAYHFKRILSFGEGQREVLEEKRASVC